jgi:mannosylglucosylglycerate synthase
LETWEVCKWEAEGMGKKVALLHYTAPPVVGGVESVLAHHARQMTAAGHAVTILAARGEQWAADIAFLRLPLADSRHPDVLAAKAQLDAGRIPPGFQAQVDELAAGLQTALAGTDVLIAHNVCSLNKNLALTAALHQLSGRPGFPRLILWHHDLAWTTPRYLPELHAGYPWDLLRTDWPGVTQVVVSAERQRELAQLLGVAPARIHVVPNGIDVATFLKLEPTTAQLVDKLDLLSAAPLLLLPVRITPRKNIELALRVVAELRAAAPASQPELSRPVLVVTGPLGPHNPANGHYLEQLQALRDQLGLAHAVAFLAEQVQGYLPDPIIADFFRLADALFLPSREEGFGIPMLEAAFSRRPIFCTDIPPLRELGGPDAVYFSPDASPALVAGLIQHSLSADPAFRFAARARAAFTWKQIYAEHVEPLLTEAET